MRSPLLRPPRTMVVDPRPTTMVDRKETKKEEAMNEK
jgi:hypothetical protein